MTHDFRAAYGYAQRMADFVTERIDFQHRKQIDLATKEALRIMAQVQDLMERKKPTNLDLSSAEIVEEGCFDCPLCEGDGIVDGEQYVNIDGCALNVLFSGIGDEHIRWKKLINDIWFALAAAPKAGE